MLTPAKWELYGGTWTYTTAAKLWHSVLLVSYNFWSSLLVQPHVECVAVIQPDRTWVSVTIASPYLGRAAACSWCTSLNWCYTEQATAAASRLRTRTLKLQTDLLGVSATPTSFSIQPLPSNKTSGWSSLSITLFPIIHTITHSRRWLMIGTFFFTHVQENKLYLQELEVFLCFRSIPTKSVMLEHTILFCAVCWTPRKVPW